jgi:hypothetical protein
VCALPLAASECPAVLLDGVSRTDTFSVRLRVNGKLPLAMSGFRFKR